MLAYGVCDDEEYFYDFIDEILADVGAAPDKLGMHFKCGQILHLVVRTTYTDNQDRSSTVSRQVRGHSHKVIKHHILVLQVNGQEIYSLLIKQKKNCRPLWLSLRPQVRQCSFVHVPCCSYRGVV